MVYEKGREVFRADLQDDAVAHSLHRDAAASTGKAFLAHDGSSGQVAGHGVAGGALPESTTDEDEGRPSVVPFVEESLAGRNGPPGATIDKSGNDLGRLEADDASEDLADACLLDASRRLAAHLSGKLGVATKDGLEHLPTQGPHRARRAVPGPYGGGPLATDQRDELPDQLARAHLRDDVAVRPHDVQAPGLDEVGVASHIPALDEHLSRGDLSWRGKDVVREDVHDVRSGWKVCRHGAPP